MVFKTHITPDNKPAGLFRRSRKQIEITLTLKWRDMSGAWRECDIWQDDSGAPVLLENDKYIIGNIAGYRGDVEKQVTADELAWFDEHFTRWAV